MKSIQSILLPVLLSLAVLPLLAACGETTALPLATSTYDPCASGNLVAEIKPVNDLMREFDDGAKLATVIQVEQLVYVVPSLQEVHRRAEDLGVPACLADLKSLQLDYMNTVINTLLVFIQLRDTNTAVVAQGVTQAQALHQQYNQELARLVGATLVPAEQSTPSILATATP